MSQILNDDPAGGGSRLLSSTARAENMNTVLTEIKRHKWSLGAFLKDLFSSGENGYEPSQKQRQTVSKFLGAQSTIGVDEIVELIYRNKYSRPKAVRASQNRPAHEVIPGKSAPHSSVRWASSIIRTPQRLRKRVFMISFLNSSDCKDSGESVTT